MLALPVALVAIHAVVHVPADVRMFEIGRVVISMASGALKNGVVACIRVAGSAHAIRVAMIQIEIRVIECRSGPSGGGVARGARRWEAGGRMVRVRRPVIVRLMAAHAGRR